MRLARGICVVIFVAGMMGSAGVRPGAAQGGAVKAIFEKYDLFGVFAWDCSKPPNKDNNWYFVNRLIDPDHVQRDFMESSTSRLWFMIIDNASETGQGEINVSGTRNGQRTNGVWRIEKNRMMQWAALQGSKQIISGGRYVITGKDLPWLNKCDGAHSEMPTQGSREFHQLIP